MHFPESLRSIGRNRFLDGILYLGWSGSCVEFETSSDSLSLTLHTSGPMNGWPARVGIFVDDFTNPVVREMVTRPVQHLSLPLKKGGGKVRIMKLSEQAFGVLGISDLHVSGDIRPTPARDRRIEFIGDSITCGYGVEAGPSDVFATSTENPASAYALLASEALHADASLTAWSGIGLTSAWVPETAEKPSDDLLMSRLYPRSDLRLDDWLGLEPVPHDFARDPVDLVVINLGTNDASWTRKIPEREEAFAQAYRRFLCQVSDARPGTPILCTCGLMEQSLCGIIRQEQERFASAHPGLKTGFLCFPLQQPSDSYGADGHPSAATHEKAAKILEESIRNLMDWT